MEGWIPGFYSLLPGEALLSIDLLCVPSRVCLCVCYRASGNGGRILEPSPFPQEEYEVRAFVIVIVIVLGKSCFCL